MPPAYTTAQKASIQTLVGMTGMDRTTAAKLLKQNGWNDNAAANAFFGGGANTASSPHKAAATKLFDSYRDDPKEYPDEIHIDGTMQMLQEMDIDLEGVGPLIFSEAVGAPVFGKLERTPFVDGLCAAGVSDLSGIRKLVEERTSRLAEPSFKSEFKNIYKHSFVLARPEGQKAVPLDVAIVFWRLLFNEPSLQWSTTQSPFLEWWIEFLENRWKRSVNKDMWDQTLAFAHKTLEDESLGWWSEDSAWPGVIDEFVEYVQTEQRGGSDMDTA
ncbi:hypothetical protein AAFC00_000050 [Neodothiora populina]|uniref:Defective in cullin neddylation protein n=1 Tax=Neodothiora populina TaxID=2781224 RepID=A0ABR3P1E4_9PEZI